MIGDYQGSPVAAVKSSGVEEFNMATFSRDAFGRTEGAGSGGTQSGGTGYAGGSTSTTSGGLTYFRNRWYDAGTGRFLTQDPIGLAGGVNLYAYAGESPVDFSDPFGLGPCQVKTTGEDGVSRCLDQQITLAAIGSVLTIAVAETRVGEAISWIKGLFSKEEETSSAAAGSPPGAEDFRGKSSDKAGRMLPKGWKPSEARNGMGTRYADPDQPGNQIRIMDGNPKDPNPVKQGPYIRTSYEGKVSDPIPLKGNPTIP